jgi:hypothetical protein
MMTILLQDYDNNETFFSFNDAIIMFGGLNEKNIITIFTFAAFPCFKHYPFISRESCGIQPIGRKSR